MTNPKAPSLVDAAKAVIVDAVNVDEFLPTSIAELRAALAVHQEQERETLAMLMDARERLAFLDVLTFVKVKSRRQAKGESAAQMNAKYHADMLELAATERVLARLAAEIASRSENGK